MQNNLYRYSYNEGESGGVVIANSEEEARMLAAQYLVEYLSLPLDAILGSEDDIPLLLVWRRDIDDYYDENHPAVINCYGD